MILVAALAAFYASAHAGAVVATLGAPQTGKTTAVMQADAQGAFPRRVVFDPYARRDRLELKRGKRVRAWPGMLITPEQLLRNRRAVLDVADLRLVVCPEGTPNSEQLGKYFNALCEQLWFSGDVDLIAEEIGRYGRQATEWVMQLGSGSGHAGMRLFLICQSWGRVAIDARRHTSHVVALAQGEESDIKALRDRCGDAFAARVRALRKGDPALTWALGATMQPEHSL